MKTRDLASFAVSIAIHVALIAALILLVSTAPRADLRSTTVGLRVFDKPGALAPMNQNGDAANTAGLGGSALDEGRDGRQRVPARRPSPIQARPEPRADSRIIPTEPVEKTMETDTGAMAAGGPERAAVRDDAAGTVAATTPGTGIAGDSAYVADGGSSDLAPGDVGTVGVRVAGAHAAAATGSGTGGGSGSGNGDGTLNNDRSTRYALAVRQAIEKRGAYPGTARRLGLEGHVKMLVSIDSNGAVAGTRIQTSSGFRELDDAALASAARLRDLPPPPDGRPVDILVPVRFSMRRM